jgi:hypothetical protein
MGDRLSHYLSPITYNLIPITYHLFDIDMGDGFDILMIECIFC